MKYRIVPPAARQRKLKRRAAGAGERLLMKGFITNGALI